jgi:uncharacterized lipoprotein YbaY
MSTNMVPRLIVLGLTTIAMGGTMPAAMAKISADALSQGTGFNCSTREVFTPEKKAWCAAQLAQVPSAMAEMNELTETLVFFQTASYAVRVYDTDGQLRLNLHNKQTGITELLGVEAIAQSDPTGTTYRHAGDLPVAVAIAPSSETQITVNGTTLQDYETVTGTVFYRPRIALPPNAVIEISLVDVSRADAPAVTVATQQSLVGQQIPFPFTLIYDPGDIDSRFAYGIQARITVDGELQFVTTSNFPVITADNPTTDVAVEVDLVDSDLATDTPMQMNTVWQLQRIQYNNDTVLAPNSPENYTIEFMEDGQLSIRADCNQVLGTFTETGNSMAIALGPSTLAACGPDSIDQQYVQALGGAATYFFQDGDLFIDIMADTGTMQFSAAN